MKELESRVIDQFRTKLEYKQAVKEKKLFGKLRLHPGLKVWEMILVPRKDGDIVKGLDPQTGAIDPDLTEVLEAVYSESDTVVMGRSPLVLDFGEEVKFKDPKLGGITGLNFGEIQPGIKRKLTITDGNIYEAASSARVARKKIIKKYFPSQFIGQLTVDDFVEIALAAKL